MRSSNATVRDTILSPRRFQTLILGQERLCLRLEGLADSLPDRIDTLAATRLAARIPPFLAACQRREEHDVFPTLIARDPSLRPTLLRLRAEHLEDEDHAGLVAETLTAFARDPRRSGADRLGYLLRGLFQPLRRHAAFDRMVVLPLYRQAMAELPPLTSPPRTAARPDRGW